MSAASENDIMKLVRTAGKKPDAAGLSKAINELRSRDYLTNVNKAIIEEWIKSEFPKSIRYLANEMLKEDEDEQDEKEEKIPSWDARNICSESTQNDLSGEVLPRDLSQVTSFLLPKGRKSECITEKDLAMLLRPKAQRDRIYMYDSKSQDVMLSTPVHRLPSSGIWILGSTYYLRMFRVYQLESFGKHIISSQIHTVSGIWRQDHELFIAKPLHYEDFVAFIKSNISLPSAPSACACLFGPRSEDWSDVFRTNYPTKDCGWLIPTWNGFPVVLAKDCGELLSWDYYKITLPIAEEISSQPTEREIEEAEESEEKKLEESEENELAESVEPKWTDLATKIIWGYERTVNMQMYLRGSGNNVKIIIPSNYQAKLFVKTRAIQLIFSPDGVKTEELRDEKIKDLTEVFVKESSGPSEISLVIILPANEIPFEPLKVTSKFLLFNDGSLGLDSVFQFQQTELNQVIKIKNPIFLDASMSTFRSAGM